MTRKTFKQKMRERADLYKISEEEPTPLTEEQKAQNRIWLEKHKPDFLKKVIHNPLRNR